MSGDRMNTYANNTKVSEDRSRQEIERLLMKHGADEFGYITRRHEARIGFVLKSLRFEMSVPLPDPEEQRFWRTPERGHKRSEAKAKEAWQQEVRRRWRSLTAVVKAKLIAIEDGVSTLEQEFLPYMVTANGATVYERLKPQLEQAKEQGQPLQLEAK